MTLDELADECWDALPPIRKRLAGKAAVRRMVADAVAEWDGTTDATLLMNRIQMRRSTGTEYGFALMTILLTAVLVAVIQWLVQRWLDRHFTEDDVARWKAEAAK